MKRLARIFTFAMLGCGRVAVTPQTPVTPPPVVQPAATVVVMAFGATWCPYCKTDIPKIAKELKRLDPTGEKVEFRVYVTTGARSTEPPSDYVSKAYVRSLGLPESLAYSDPWHWKMFKKYVGPDLAIPAAAVILPNGSFESFRAGASFDPTDIARFAVSK